MNLLFASAAAANGSLSLSLVTFCRVHPARDPWFYVALVQTLFARAKPDDAMSEFNSAVSRC
jgi:hypothetical protein